MVLIELDLSTVGARRVHFSIDPVELGKPI
jgi:hypothetical protein